MNRDLQIRASKDSDIAAITQIYAHHVSHGTASFEIEPPDAEEMARRRLAWRGPALPSAVAKIAPPVVGYPYATLSPARFAYRFTLEASVYIHPDHVGRGMGAAPLSQLIPACKEWGCRQ